MAGLFLNFYQVEIPVGIISIDSINYAAYSSKEAFASLKEQLSKDHLYRDDKKILIWNNRNSEISYPGIQRVQIDLSRKAKIVSRILEVSVIEFLKEKLKDYNIYKNRHSNTWEIVSSSDLLKKSIAGLQVNRVVHFSPCFFSQEDKLLVGFTLSTSLKNSFTWSKAEFEKYGIDIKGLKSNNEVIYANRQSINRFLESKGAANQYNQIISEENKNERCFYVINKLYEWLQKNKSEIRMPFNMLVSNIIKRYLPFENDLVKPEIINKPQRYFYSNRRNTNGLKYYNQMVKAYQPYSLELYQNKEILIGVICPKEFQGETEGFIKKIEVKLKEDFHFKFLKFSLKIIANSDLDTYKEVLYDAEILKANLIYVIVTEAQEKLHPSRSPYFVCKAKFIGNGIPTQDVQIETIRRNLNTLTMTNIALNSYAKLGGTAWTVEKEDKLRDELIVGIGSTISDSGQHVLGIAQVFHNDGRYMTGDCSPLSSFNDYTKNLEEHLYRTLKPYVEAMNNSGTFRLIFHLFKSASEEYEIKAIDSLKDRFANYKIEYALVHLGYGHNFRLYYNDGKNEIVQGTYVQLSKHSALLHFVKQSDLPLKIDLDRRSTFTSLFYIAKQVYWFSHLSHRSYIPSKRTVTIMYPSLMARITEELKKVDSWDYERLKAVSDKLWFI